MARFYQPKKKKQPDTRHQQVTISRLDHQGAGIAFSGHKPVFIDGALPGEEVVIQLTEDKSKFARASLIKVLNASGDRVEPYCPHYKECGGCNLQHANHTAQVKYKQDALRQLIRKFSGEELDLTEPVTGKEWGYRRRVRLSLKVNRKTGELEFGFRKKQSKQIVMVTDCPALSEEINSLLPGLFELLSGIKKKEKLGHLELALGDNFPVIMLRVTAPLKEHELSVLSDYASDNDAALYVLDEKDALQKVCGEMPFYEETGYTMPFLPTNFIQVNREVNQKMVEQAIDWLDLQESDRVLDLFCGLGNFSLPVAARACRVVGVEGVDEMVEQAKENARCNGVENTEFWQANLEEGIKNKVWAGNNFNKVLLDPARAGASGVVDQLSELGAKRIVYVSCNPATLARDCQSLLEQGFKLIRLGMLDMFPHTSHLESMALFEK